MSRGLTHERKETPGLVAKLRIRHEVATGVGDGELLDNPARYDGKTVRVEGEVRESAGGLGLGAYQVRDTTGTLTVVSEQSGPPRSGSKVSVKGRFEALITLGSRSLAVLREISRDTR